MPHPPHSPWFDMPNNIGNFKLFHLNYLFYSINILICFSVYFLMHETFMLLNTNFCLICKDRRMWLWNYFFPLASIYFLSTRVVIMFLNASSFPWLYVYNFKKRLGQLFSICNNNIGKTIHKNVKCVTLAFRVRPATCLPCVRLPEMPILCTFTLKTATTVFTKSWITINFCHVLSPETKVTH
jgi:hypothetical protein